MSEALKRTTTPENTTEREQAEREQWVENKAVTLLKEAEKNELQTVRVEKLDNEQRWKMMIRVATQIIEDLNANPVKEGESDQNLLEERRRLRATAEFIGKIISAEKILTQKAELDEYLVKRKLTHAAKFANLSPTLH